jgi:hypothetical protein
MIGSLKLRPVGREQIKPGFVVLGQSGTELMVGIATIPFKDGYPCSVAILSPTGPLGAPSLHTHDALKGQLLLHVVDAEFDFDVGDLKPTTQEPYPGCLVYCPDGWGVVVSRGENVTDFINLDSGEFLEDYGKQVLITTKWRIVARDSLGNYRTVWPGVPSRT